MDRRHWSIGYFSGSQILEQLPFKRRKMTDCHTAFDSLVLKLEPRRLHFKQGLGWLWCKLFMNHILRRTGLFSPNILFERKRKVAILGQVGLMEAIHIREDSALLKGYRRDREMKESTRSWRRMWLVKDEGFSKTEKKQVKRSKAIYPKPPKRVFFFCAFPHSALSAFSVHLEVFTPSSHFLKILRVTLKDSAQLSPPQ